MFLLADGTVVYSASDLSAAAGCEWAVMRRLDARLGRIESPPAATDDMLERTARLGDRHEQRFLEQLRSRVAVVEIPRPERSGDPSEVVALTTAAFESGAAAVYQAAFFDGRFLGYADFIIRDSDGRYDVYDTKLARHAKITALLQLAAYGDQLLSLGVPTGSTVYLVLGDDTVSEHRLDDILPVYRRRRARLELLVDERVADASPTPWGDPRYAACGRCEVCEEQVQLYRDLLLVAGLRVTQRARLRDAGISTIERLATSAGPVPGLSDAVVAALRDQAAVQLSPGLAWRIVNPTAFAAIPAPDAGDIFFDFEGDPLHREGTVWGLDYLFGLVEADETFRTFWAHDLAQEKQALVDFLAYVSERRQKHPSLHIYHYASYERTHLLSIAARHGVGEEAVDDLLRSGVLVDLYPIVKQSLRVGSRSYSLKKLEPLYMGDRGRSGVSTAADSITEYVRSRDLLDSGDADEAARVLGEIATYNEYDCISTLALRDWLLARATESGIWPAGGDELRLDVPVAEPDPVHVQLAAIVDDFPPGERTADQSAIALASAAIDYHRREGKSFWWDHFARLVAPLEDWADTRDVFVVESAEVVRRWGIEGRARTQSRELRLTGTAAPGSSFRESDSPWVVYDPPFPPIDAGRDPAARVTHRRTRVTVAEDGSLQLTERLGSGMPTYDQLPLALMPSSPPNPGTQVTAISEWGRALLDAYPQLMPNAALDILRRVPPRGSAGGTTPDLLVSGTVADRMRDALLSLDHSYLAVQGPPGTGKTWNGARAIADLVENHGWRVGVVAQSHATVEHMLSAVVGAGLDPLRVGKKPRPGAESAPTAWTKLTDTTLAELTAGPGFVVGGTAWLFSNAARIPRQGLDLLVIDEAGQYSLASTIAVSVSATRLLLLGDPQQLPQVSQGTHPEPVDVSALGWLSAGHDVLPPAFGLFLDASHRMHPSLCAPVSELSYEGRLHSVASDRLLAGIAPGLHPVPVVASDNSTSSPEEADVVLAIVRDLVGRSWTSAGVTTALTAQDLIVVAPYNSQVQLVRETLDTAGFDAVPVGTVDKFQGREAAVAIVSLAASSAADVPRGLEFLLLANRLNVAISRAQWAAWLLYSPALIEYLPTNVAALAQLSAFIRLVETNVEPRAASRDGQS
ncbi:MAG: TM0106 family RecB-like putative nuclease [Actinomycetota bacterium]